MPRLFVSLMRATAVVVIVGCAASSGGGPAPQTYSKDLGAVTAHDLSRWTLDILQRYQFEMERTRTNSPSYALFVTRWRGRYPLQDELDVGVVEARTQITVRGRVRRPAAGGMPALMVAVFSAENMVRMADSLEWRRGFMSPMFREYIEEIADRLKTELQSGVRVF